MLENQLSRWGAISKVLEGVSPKSKVFFVGDTDDTGFINFVNEFPPDKDGVVRVYSSMFDTTLLANLSASRKDVVLVMPGHNESITTDKSIAVNGVSFIGLGKGNNRPTVKYDDTAASISLDTDNILFENFRLLASVSGITRALDVQGAGVTVRRNSFQFDTNGDDFVTGVRVGAAGDHVSIEDNEFLMEDTAGPSEAILVTGGADYVKIKRNYITGDYSNAAIETDSTAASQGILVEENIINNSDTAGLAIEHSHPSTRGVNVRNLMGVGDTTPATMDDFIEAGLTKWFENYLANDAGESGTLVPTTVSST